MLSIYEAKYSSFLFVDSHLYKYRCSGSSRIIRDILTGPGGVFGEETVRANHIGNNPEQNSLIPINYMSVGWGSTLVRMSYDLFSVDDNIYILTDHFFLLFYLSTSAQQPFTVSELSPHSHQDGFGPPICSCHSLHANLNAILTTRNNNLFWITGTATTRIDILYSNPLAGISPSVVSQAWLVRSS